MKTAFQQFCRRPLTESQQSLLDEMKPYTSHLADDIPENSPTRLFYALLRLEETCIEEENRAEYANEYLINARELDQLFDLADTMRRLGLDGPTGRLRKDDLEALSQSRDILNRFLVRQKKTLDHLTEDCATLKENLDSMVIQFKIAVEGKDWETLAWLYFHSKEETQKAAVIGQNNPEQVIPFPREKSAQQTAMKLKEKFSGLAKLYIGDFLDEFGEPFAVTQSGAMHQQQLANANAYEVVVSFVKELHEHLSTTLTAQTRPPHKTGNTSQFPNKLVLVK